MAEKANKESRKAELFGYRLLAIGITLLREPHPITSPSCLESAEKRFEIIKEFMKDYAPE